MAGAATYPSLDGRCAFVTGGATGIGAAIVAALAGQGAKVAFVDIEQAAADALAQTLTGDGATVWHRPVDVTETAGLKRAIEEAAGSLGGLDILINNVANDTRHDPLETSEQDWHGLIAVNLDAAFFAAQTAVGLMRGRGRGAIVNLSSINALTGPPRMPAYVAAKSAILGLTKSLAREYGGDGIRVNAVAPGWVVTDRQLRTWLTPQAEAAWMEQVALKDRLLPDDVARLVLFLASDEARMITGQTFVIDGGRT